MVLFQVCSFSEKMFFFSLVLALAWQIKNEACFKQFFACDRFLEAIFGSI